MWLEKKHEWKKQNRKWKIITVNGKIKTVNGKNKTVKENFPNPKLFFLNPRWKFNWRVGKCFFFTSEKKYSCFWHSTPTATTSTGLFLLQYTVSYSEDFFSRCEDFFPKQLSKTCGSYEKIFAFKSWHKSAWYLACLLW